MHPARIGSTPVVREAAPAKALQFHPPLNSDAEGIVDYFVECDVLKRESAAASYVRTIFSAPPDALRVSRIARRVYVSRRTLGRQFRVAGLPSPVDWVALARAVMAHRTLTRGEPLRVAASAAGYPDQFSMSNAFHRITGLRPSKIREVSRGELLNVWVARQRDAGALTGPPAPAVPSCPLCGAPRAAC